MKFQIAAAARSRTWRVLLGAPTLLVVLLIDPTIGTALGQSTAAQACRSGEEIEDQGMIFVRVCAHTFTMGSAEDDPRSLSRERPAHQVTLSEFWIGKLEVTNEQYREFLAEHPGDPNLPATSVSWFEARSFCESRGFQLPTEAQWEAAARAGQTSAWSFGDDEEDLGRYGWYSDNAGRQAQPVGTREPNAWGLHDMHGNVMEWVADEYALYSEEAKVDPTGPAEKPTAVARVLRGGSALARAKSLRSAARIRYAPELKFEAVGFRCVRSGPASP